MGSERQVDLERQVQVVDQERIAALAQTAQAEQRRRTHLLLHGGHSDPVQRLLLVLQPGTSVRPHQHSQQWEMLILQQGRIDLFHFSDAGCLLDRIELSRAAPIVQIPVGLWHGAVILEPDTAVMEIKPGPYRPNEFADWAPPEGDPQAARFVTWATAAGPSQCWSPPG